jgi:hemerythrin-like domain-containing protein
MKSIVQLMSADHRQCDDRFVAAERFVAGGAWAEANAAFGDFCAAMLRHFDAEEAILFPAFEARTGMSMGPTRVMRGEHDQIRQLLAAAKVALDQRDADDYSGNAETLLIMMQQHNMKEENILYPMSDQHLANELDSLLEKLQSRIAAVGDRP